MTGPIFHMIPDAPKPVAPYSHVVEQDGWLFVTGQLATDPADDALPLPEGIEAQTRKVMDNLQRALRGAGASLADVVCVRIFLTRVRAGLPRHERLVCDLLPGGPPASADDGGRHGAGAGRDCGD